MPQLVRPSLLINVRGVRDYTPTIPPTDSFLLLEDGVSYLLLEDGVSKLILEF